MTALTPDKICKSSSRHGGAQSSPSVSALALWARIEPGSEWATIISMLFEFDIRLLQKILAKERIRVVDLA